MRKWMVEFLRKIENRGIKIARVNSILNTKSINLVIYFNFVWCWVRSVGRGFSVRSPFIEKSMYHIIK